MAHGGGFWDIRGYFNGDFATQEQGGLTENIVFSNDTKTPERGKGGFFSSYFNGEVDSFGKPRE